MKVIFSRQASTSTSIVGDHHHVDHPEFKMKWSTPVRVRSEHVALLECPNGERFLSLKSNQHGGDFFIYISNNIQLSSKVIPWKNEYEFGPPPELEPEFNLDEIISAQEIVADLS